MKIVDPMKSCCLVVVPCYNEERRLDVSAFRNFLEHTQEVDFVFVNDGSTDCTAGLLRELRESVPARVRVVTLPRRRGKAEAVRQGFVRALAEEPQYVGYWDADLSAPLTSIQAFLRVLQAEHELEVVLGSRAGLTNASQGRSLGRRFLGFVFSYATNFVLALPFRDTQCGAKLIRVTSRTSEVFGRRFHTDWVFDVEMLARYRDLMIRDGLVVVTAIQERCVQSWTEMPGSKLNSLGLFRAFWDLLYLVARTLIH